MNPHSLDNSRSLPEYANMPPWDLPLYNTAPGTLRPPPPMSLRGHPLPLIPQQQLGRVHSTFIELTHLRPSPLSLTGKEYPATPNPPPRQNSHFPSHFPPTSKDVLGFRLCSRHAHSNRGS